MLTTLSEQKVRKEGGLSFFFLLLPQLNQDVDISKHTHQQATPSHTNSLEIAYKHYLRAFSRWPKDALRPESQLQDAIRKRVDRQLLPQSSATTTQTQTQTPPGAGGAFPKLADERVELEQANALYSLLENRYSRKVSNALEAHERQLCCVCGGVFSYC